MTLSISLKVRQKLARKTPSVSVPEIEQCFANRTGTYLIDTRESHQSDPPTKWFIAETDYGRKLKICFIQDGSTIIIKTAYDPNQDELRIYSKFADTD